MLKKMIVTVSAFLMLAGIAGAATTAYTDMATLGTTAATSPALFYKPSNKVFVFYKSDLGANAQNYNIIAKHTSGNRTFATSNMSTAIFYKEDGTVKDGVALDASKAATLLGAAAGESNFGALSSTPPWTGM